MRHQLSVFSVFENVITGRESMRRDMVVALVRVAMEGPGAATDASLDPTDASLSQAALDSWPLHCGKIYNRELATRNRVKNHKYHSKTHLNAVG